MTKNALVNFILLVFFIFKFQCLPLKRRSVQEYMYMTSSFDFCMRYLTKNSVTGCSSQKSGNRGRLIDISSLDDLMSYENSYPIIILIPAQKDILEFAMFHAPMVVGIFIDGEMTINKTETHFTEVSTCPEHFIGSSTPLNCSIRKNKNGIFRFGAPNRLTFLVFCRFWFLGFFATPDSHFCAENQKGFVF